MEEAEVSQNITETAGLLKCRRDSGAVGYGSFARMLAILAQTVACQARRLAQLFHNRAVLRVSCSKAYSCLQPTRTCAGLVDARSICLNTLALCTVAQCVCAHLRLDTSLTDGAAATETYPGPAGGVIGADGAPLRLSANVFRPAPKRLTHRTALRAKEQLNLILAIHAPVKEWHPPDGVPCSCSDDVRCACLGFWNVDQGVQIVYNDPRIHVVQQASEVTTDSRGTARPVLLLTKWKYTPGV